ncbi:GNAT family N-acetyltransferase [Cellulosimicrobium cellulans]|uniref:GNAT family N-acetyltransferase n=1 Tax=Cellulosimicrobium cellulans TaxID=1710 RepID=UPI0020CC7EE5|nr:GNAT family N-acetyltransferase [Cellulosimicrobium cellulans]
MDVEVRPAVGSYGDFATVVGPRKAGVRGCWCMSYRDSRVSAEERAAFMADLCRNEPGPGVLAYVGGDVAGWCSVAPRSTYRRLTNARTIPFVDELDAWSAVCFVVRSGYRRRWLMHDLLAGAVEHGAPAIEGYPVDAGGERVDVISGYVGTVALFEQAGFVRAASTTGVSGGVPRVVMRRALA